MFGTAAFGQLGFGQVIGQVFSPLAVTAALSVAPQAALTAPSPLAAVSGYTLATTATLTTGTNRFEASAGISLGMQAPLALRATLTARPTITVGIGEPIFDPAIFDGFTLFDTRRRSSTQLLVSGPLLAASTLTIGVAAPKLVVGSIAFTADTTVLLGTTATLRSLPATFAVAATLPLGVAANLQKTGFGASDVVIAFNGAITQAVRVGSLTITDELNEAPNSCDFIVDGSPPAVGTDVRIGLRDLLPASLLFGGEVLKVTQTFAGRPSHPAWSVSCRDYTFLINRRKVWKKWVNTSATTIAADLVNTYTSGFSTAGIVSGLAAIDVEFEGLDVMAALSKVASLIGGYCDVTSSKVVRLFITNTDPPLTLTDIDPRFKFTPALNFTRDLSQVRTVVQVKGIGKAVAGNSGMRIGAGATVLPLADVEPFGVDPGQAITDDQELLTYSATTPGGAVGKVGTTASPINTILAQLAPSVVGGLIGTYYWAVAFANAAGETPISLPSNQLACPDRTSPTSTIGIGTTGAVGPLVGRYGYKVANVTSRGQTLLGPETARTANNLQRPNAPSVSTASPPGPFVGGGNSWAYASSFVTPYGETIPSAQTIWTPSTILLAQVTSAVSEPFGGLLDGPYYVGVTNVTALGEIGLAATYIGTNYHTTGPAGVTIMRWDTGGRVETGYQYFYACSGYHEQWGETTLGPSQSFYNQAGVGVKFTIRLPAPLPNQTGMRLYRRASPISDPSYSSAWQLVGEFWGNQDILDNYSQGELGDQYPKQSRAGGRVWYTLSSSPESGVVARRIYRTKSNGTEYFLVGEVQNNYNGAQFLDVAADSALTQRSPAVATTGKSSFVSAAAGPAGVTARRIYRTKVNSSQLLLVGEIKDNSSSGMIDTLKDDGLTVGAPGSQSGIGDTHVLTSIQPGPPGTLARTLYRTKANGSEFFLLGRLSDNTSTSFVDNVPDADLGEAGPLVNTAGASAAQLIGIPIGGPGVTKRVLYRTNGSGNVATFKYLATIDNNTDTTFIDDKPDDALGRPPSEASNLGALPGETSLALDNVNGFPSLGWVRAENQYIAYNGISYTGGGRGTLNNIAALNPISQITRSGNIATAITFYTHGFRVDDIVTVIGANQTEYNGVRKILSASGSVFTYKIEGFPASPATGTMSVGVNGAIVAAIPGGAIVQAVPMLTGVSGLTRPIAIGATVSLWVVRQSATGITQLQQLEGGDGIRQYAISDASLDSIVACQKRGDADLLLFQFAQVSFSYRTQDTQTRSGKTVHVNLPAPTNLIGDFLIQSVRINNIDQAARTMPFFDVTVSSTRFSLEDLLRHVVWSR